MADKSPVRILLVKDGENFYMRPLGDQPPVHIAFVDTANEKPDGQGQIRALIPGGGTEPEVNTLLDQGKADMEAYVQSGNFERDRHIQSQAAELNQLRGNSGQPATANEA